MAKKNRRSAPVHAALGPATLADVAIALEGARGLSRTRARDLISAVKRVSAMLENEPSAIVVDVGAIGARLATVNPVALGITTKRLANIRSDFLAALKASGLIAPTAFRKSPLSPSWLEFFEQHSGRRVEIGLSRLARYASAHGLAPKGIKDEVIADLIKAVREASLCPRPKALHRQIALIWNEVAQDPALGLQRVTVPSSRVPKRIDWNVVPKAFRRDLDNYLSWCAVSDPFALDARRRALAQRTLQLRRDEIHAAVTALVESGTKPAGIRSLADLVEPDNLKTILRRRLEYKTNTFNHFLGKTLVQVAHEWVKVDAGAAAELKRLVSKIPAPVAGLTERNKRALRQFDDPAVLRRLYRLPEILWTEARRGKPNRRTLAQAQVALAVAIECYTAMRLQNLVSLEFETHLFLREGVRAVSSLEIPGHEVKNRMDLAFDIPPGLAKMLIEYRDHLAPKIIGHRPTRLFVNVDGTPKKQANLSVLIMDYLRRRAGIVLTPHQFRHLAAKVVLEARPGAFEFVKQFLGHTSIKTTVSAYAGIDTRRAARWHQHLVEQALATQMPLRPSRKRAS
jgi:integrase